MPGKQRGSAAVTFPASTTHGTWLNGTPDFVIPAGTWQVLITASLSLTNNGIGMLRSEARLFNVTDNVVVNTMSVGNSDYISGVSPDTVGSITRILNIQLLVDTTFRMQYEKVTQSGAPNVGQALSGNGTVTWYALS